MRVRISTLIAGAMALCLAGPLAAQPSFPSKPVRIIVPAPAGGAVDGFARVLGEYLSARWKQPVVVEPRPGAASNIGTMAVKNSEPDGHTLLATTWSTFLSNPHLFKAAAWSPTRDFIGAAAIGYTSTVLVVPESVPAHNLRELIALVKSKPDAMTAAMVFGTTAQLNFESLKRSAGLQMVMAPFNGAPPITLALLNGSVQMGLLQPAGVLPHIQSGKLKAIAVASPKRTDLLPDVPTVAEVGHPELSLTPWYGLSAPGGTPASVIQEINTAVNEAMATPKVREDLRKLGVELAPKMSVREVNAMVETDANTYANVIKTLGITAQ